MKDLVLKNINLNEDEIKKIHSLVLMDKPEDKGVYRRIPVKIMGSYHEPPQPFLVQPQMEQLMAKNDQNKKAMHPLERIAKFHLDFECIHPFIDGNCRTGRLIFNLELMQSGYPPVNIKFTDNKRYYQAFDAYWRDNDAAEMVNMIAEYVGGRLEQYLRILESDI